MAGSSFGTVFRITTWGESHGKASGVVIDGCPSGLPLCEQDIQSYLDRRRPGCTPFSTSRKEPDQVEILSGVFHGYTTGTPISLMIRNISQDSGDYESLASCYRPGHADFTYEAKYGFRDYRGGGRASGRETVGRVAAGAVAVRILQELGIQFLTYTRSIGPVSIDYSRFDPDAIRTTPTFMPDSQASREAEAYLEKVAENSDSAGGVVECRIRNVPAGIGEPVFEKLDASLAKAVMSIGAVKAVEIGDGFEITKKNGSTANDCFHMQDGKAVKNTNHSGGILGGLSDGDEIVLRAHFKPTPSIGSTQETVTCDGKEISLNIHGRHDPVIVPRAVVVVESMAALTLLDALFLNMSSELESLKTFYRPD